MLKIKVDLWGETLGVTCALCVCVCGGGGGGGGGDCFKNRKLHSQFSKKSDLFYQLKAHTHIYIYIHVIFH